MVILLVDTTPPVGTTAAALMLEASIGLVVATPLYSEIVMALQHRPDPVKVAVMVLAEALVLNE